MSRYQRWECWTLWTLMAIWLMGSSVMRCSFISLDRSVGTGSRETADGREDAVDVRQGGVLEVGGERDGLLDGDPGVLRLRAGLEQQGGDLQAAVHPDGQADQGHVRALTAHGSRPERDRLDDGGHLAADPVGGDDAGEVDRLPAVAGQVLQHLDVEQLRGQEDHELVALQRGEHEPGSVRRGRGHHDRDRRVGRERAPVGLLVLAAVGVPAPRPGADHQRDIPAATGEVAELRGTVDDGGPADRGEVDHVELDDRLQAGHRRADAGVHERALADRGVADPVVAEPGEQVAAQQAHVLAPGEDTVVGRHGLAEGVVDRLVEGHDGHLVPPLGVPNTGRPATAARAAVMTGSISARSCASMRSASPTASSGRALARGSIVEPIAQSRAARAPRLVISPTPPAFWAAPPPSALTPSFSPGPHAAAMTSGVRSRRTRPSPSKCPPGRWQVAYRKPGPFPARARSMSRPAAAKTSSTRSPFAVSTGRPNPRARSTGVPPVTSEE